MRGVARLHLSGSEATRRQVLHGLTAAGVILSAPAVIGQARPRVVVVGGGAGGATAARHMAETLDVTLVEPNPVYRSCFFSNLAIGGFVAFDALAHDYTGVTATGVRLIQARAAGVDEGAVKLEDGTQLAFDRCVLAPGIAFREDSLPGWSPSDEERIPSAYMTGGRPERIREQILNLPEGGTWCLVAPPDPSRCPPAPYERASMAAHLLKQNNPRAKILIVDPKAKYAKQALFEEGWQEHYTGMIDRLGPDFGTGNLEIRPDAMEVVVDGMAEAADAINVIPAQQAGAIAHLAGVTDDTGWAPVEPTAMRSRLRPDVHVVGDAAHPGGIPKAASAAVSEARVAAAAIVAELTGAPLPEPSYASACWSAIAGDDSVSEATSFRPGPDGLEAVAHEISQTGEDAAVRRANWDNAFSWYASITAEIFG
ncbi:MAG: FAD-dependent oxidoreductase [Rhodobacteraceae bacterium]|nr:FAD-dependent oxidoreductase [Paracoccaceae bacterium]